MQLALFEDLGPRTDLDPNGLTCKNCGQTKKLELFPKHIGYSNGYDQRCRKCKREVENLLLSLRKENMEHKTELCTCCNQPSDRSLVLDHCHDTNTFRGWICDKCNVGIGKLGDNLDGVLNAVAYLKKFEELK